MCKVAGLCGATFLVLGIVSPAFTQTLNAPPPEPTRVQLGAGLVIGVPVGDFRARVESAGGLVGYLDVGLGRGVVSIGGEASYLVYGSESREIDLGALIPELPGAHETLTTDNAMALVHGRVRIQSPRGRWRPYVDGLVGFDYIYTETSLAGDACTDSYCDGIKATNSSDVVPSVGAGTGIIVDIGRPGGFRLDASVRYLWGGKARYLTEGAIHTVGGEAVLDVSRSRTDMVTIGFGLSFGR